MQPKALLVILLVVISNSQPTDFIPMTQQIALLCNYNIICMNSMPIPQDDISVSSSSLQQLDWIYSNDVTLELIHCPKNSFPSSADNNIC